MPHHYLSRKCPIHVLTSTAAACHLKTVPPQLGRNGGAVDLCKAASHHLPCPYFAGPRQFASSTPSFEEVVSKMSVFDMKKETWHTDVSMRQDVAQPKKTKVMSLKN